MIQLKTVCRTENAIKPIIYNAFETRKRLADDQWLADNHKQFCQAGVAACHPSSATQFPRPKKCCRWSALSALLTAAGTRHQRTIFSCCCSNCGSSSCCGFWGCCSCGRFCELTALSVRSPLTRLSHFWLADDSVLTKRHAVSQCTCARHGYKTTVNWSLCQNVTFTRLLTCRPTVVIVSCVALTYLNPERSLKI